MGIIERFFESIEKAGISSYEIEKKYGVKSAQSKLSQLKEGKTKGGKEKTLPSDLLSAVCSAREDINPDYILTGRGTPLRHQPEVTQIFHPKSIEKTEEDGLITLYDVEAAANLRTLFDNKNQNILGQINSRNLTNILVIVVRYFGGILLGTGGLIVAYKQAAADALDHAEIEERQVECAHKIHFDYPQMNDVMRILKEENASITDTQYTDGCTVYFEVCKANEARLVKRMTDLRLVKLD